MPDYDTENYNPPAPVAYVTLKNPATGALLSGIPLLMDTGADVTLLPIKVVEQIGITPEENTGFEVQVFDGESKHLKSAKLELYFLGKKFAGEYLLIDRAIGVLGRNILNNLNVLFDGPRGKWDEQK